MDVGSGASLKLTKRVLNELGMLEQYNPMIHFPENYVADLRGKNYRDQWETYIKRYWYHFLLADGSLLIYEEDSFRFLMAPLRLPTREDFLHEEFGDIWDEVFTEDDKNQYLSSSEFSIAYQNFVDSIATYSPYTPVRYDMSLDKNEYCRLTHPAFHLHIGFENNSRIPVKVKMTPFSFTMFILSTFYPKEWKRIFDEGMLSDEEKTKVKSGLETIVHIDNELWCNEHEEVRVYIG
ncbi:hypothetical protein BZJ17_06765 [Salinivibrio sp. IB574]|uniref:DUF2290 domain-containing protein n=1 Tax=Salinivibrio sp. IB574 TaxID=1909444 RepID=UPI00098904A1|nr:DUF2290 domain-containing protein [Salinivibrio sp. IB574]OOF22233.1 hypothetical protein BZJ17_06765 [Salinivibrio sp. IB574]